MNKENERLLREMEKQRDREERISAILYVSGSFLFVAILITIWLIFGY